MINIYTLRDPRTNLIFYVGASKYQPKAITSRHVATFSKTKELLRRQNIRPICEIIDTASSTQQAAQLEEYWICQMRAWGFNLDNHRHYKRYSYVGAGCKEIHHQLNRIIFNQGINAA